MKPFKEAEPLQLRSANRNNALDRQEALDFLASLGIEKEKIHLIDLVPLIEMIWADGKVQPGELVILKRWLHKHVEHINQMAGYKIIRLSDAMAFAQRFLIRQPKQGLLKKIRHCIGPVRMHTPGKGLRPQIAEKHSFCVSGYRFQLGQGIPLLSFRSVQPE